MFVIQQLLVFSLSSSWFRLDLLSFQEILFRWCEIRICSHLLEYWLFWDAEEFFWRAICVSFWNCYRRWYRLNTRRQSHSNNSWVYHSWNSEKWMIHWLIRMTWWDICKFHISFWMWLNFHLLLNAYEFCWMHVWYRFWLII